MPYYKPPIKGKAGAIDVEVALAWCRAYNKKTKMSPAKVMRAVAGGALKPAKDIQDADTPENARRARKAAWAALAFGMEQICDRVQDGTMMLSPRDAKSLADAAAALDKALGAEEAADELRGLTLKELDKKALEQMDAQWGKSA